MTPGKKVKETKTGEIGVVIARTEFADKDRGVELQIEFGDKDGSNMKTLNEKEVALYE